MRDLIIIGAGAAGLSAAMYASRQQLNTLVISEDIGGQTNMTPHIENYPGVEVMSGPDLMQVFYKQAQTFGADFDFDKVQKIEKNDTGFIVHTRNKTHEASAILLAFGLSHKPLGLKGEESYFGKGVSYCATCDGPLYKGKTVCVVGDSYTALEAADFLSTMAKEVVLIMKTGALLETSPMGKKVSKEKNVTIYKKASVSQLKGEDTLSSVVLDVDKEGKELSCDAVFVKIGLLPQTEWASSLVEIDEKKHIQTDDHGQTNVPGVFAAGDVCKGVFKQIVIAAGDGAKAALSAYKYLRQKDIDQVHVDWTTK